MNTEVNAIPIKDLWLKYSLGKTQFYARMKELGIVPERIGTQGFISPEQLKELDELHQYILKGGTTPSFLAERNGEPETRIVKSSTPILARREQVPVELALRMFEMFEPQSDPLAPQRQLQEAADRGWVLGTLQLKQILGQTPQEREYFGFKVVRCGRSGRGREIGWKVTATQDRTHG